MQFTVLALFVAVGCVMADEVDPVHQARAMMANRILTADPATFKDCRHNPETECSHKPGWKCQPLMKLCSPGNSPSMEAIEGTCSGNDRTECRPLFRCNTDKKCSFVGPRACSDVSECNAGVEGVTFKCEELPKNAPGKRCWMQCGTDNDCHGCKNDGSECRVPENFRKHIGCCQGVCQRKTACSA